MIKVGKHLFVKKAGNEFLVLNKRDMFLGKICFNLRWKRYVFEPDGGTYYSSDCGIPLFEFIAKLDNGEY